MSLRKKLISRISFFSFLFLLIFGAAGFIFTSCSNLFDDEVALEENLDDDSVDKDIDNKDDSSDEDSDNKENEKTLEPVTIKGQVCLTGAMPEAFAASRRILKAARSALPSYTDTEVDYFAFAKSGDKTVNATFGDTTATASTFSLTLVPEQTWTLTCGIKKAGTENVEDSFLLKATTSFDPATLTEGETLKFFPTPYTSTGEGQIDLSLIIDSSIKSVKLTANGSNKESWPFATASVADTSATIKTVAGSSVESVPSGSYEVLFSFYDASNSLVYATVQNITVCKGMTTKVWVTSGGDSPIDSNGFFNVSTAKIQSFASTNFYVGPTGATDSNGNPVSPADSNSGSHKAPFATLGRALQQIENYGQPTKDYKIHISGHHTIAADATAGFVISGLDSKMNSLTLTGLTGNTTDIVDGDNRFCALLVDSSKEITIENLTIKKGNAENGGGIGKKGRGKLTVNNCIIQNNNATTAGGGFCSFENAGDCTIKNCHFESNSAGSNGGGIYSRAKTLISNTEIIDNTATTSGGGCYFRDKDVTISGSQTLISNNRATNSQGGGICVATNNSLLFKEGTISENVAQLLGGGIYSIGPVTMTSGIINGNKSLNDTDCLIAGVTENQRAGGGGVCVKNTFTMSGGIISGNESGFYGGGIILITSDSKVILSGTAVIGDISKTSPSESDDDKHSNSANKGGGIFNYGGKLYIGYIDETTPDSSFSGGIGYNYVSVHGGGVYSIGSSSAEVYINKAKIQANNAGTYGGGIDIYNGTFEINDSQIKYNKADNGGGLGLGRQDGNPSCSIKNTIIQNNNAISNGAAIYLYGGNTTLSDAEITNNHAGAKAGGIFYNALGTKTLTLGTNTAESTVTVKDNTEGSTEPYSKSNVYLNATDIITIAGALSIESDVGITRASLPMATAFTIGFNTKNPDIEPNQVFSSDDNTYTVGTNVLTGEAKLRPSSGYELKWYYVVGDARIQLTNTEVQRIGVPDYHNSTLGTNFTLKKTSAGPFYNAETSDASIFTGNIYIADPVTGTQVTAGTETSAGIPYSIAAGAITAETDMYIILDFSTVYLDSENGSDRNGGWSKDYPVQTLAQAKTILTNNTKANPAIIVMSTISDEDEIAALSDITTTTYNNAVVKAHSTLADSYFISVDTGLSANLSNVTIEEGTVEVKGSLTLSGSQNFTDDLCFYLDNTGAENPLLLGSGFTNTSTKKAKIKIAKTFAASAGEKVLAPASGASIDIATAKAFFELDGTSASLYEITDEGKISPRPSGGSFYTAMDYIFTLSADKTQVTKGEESVITITPTVKRKEADGSQTHLYYNPSDSKLYEDAAHTIAAAGSNTVSWSASLMCGPDVEVENLSAASSANQFTIPGISWEDNYTLNVTATYLGVARDTSFAVECVEHAFNATAYTDNGDGTVYFGDWPQSAKASSVTVNEVVSIEIGALIYYLGSDNAWYAKYDDDYFKVEPVKWKILTTDASGKKLLFADKALFGMPYVQISSYLNDEFINSVFTPAMQNTIDLTTYGKLFLLSKEEVTNPAYGFASNDGNSGSRIKLKTDYAAKIGVQQDGSGCWWIFRAESTSAWMDYSNGNGNASGGTRNWENNKCGTVPAMWVVGY